MGWWKGRAHAVAQSCSQTGRFEGSGRLVPGQDLGCKLVPLPAPPWRTCTAVLELAHLRHRCRAGQHQQRHRGTQHAAALHLHLHAACAGDSQGGGVRQPVAEGMWAHEEQASRQPAQTRAAAYTPGTAPSGLITIHSCCRRCCCSCCSSSGDACCFWCASQPEGGKSRSCWLAAALGARAATRRRLAGCAPAASPLLACRVHGQGLAPVLARACAAQHLLPQPLPSRSVER